MSNDTEQHEEGKPSAMSTKKMIIIVSIAVVVSTSLIAGVLVYVMGSHRGVAEAGTHAKEGHEKKAAPVVYPLEPFVVNIRDGQDIRYLKLKVELETTSGPEAKGELDPFLPPMRDAVLALLSTKTLQDIQDLPGKTRLKEEILASLSKIAPSGKISRVYFTDFMVQ